MYLSIKSIFGLKALSPSLVGYLPGNLIKSVETLASAEFLLDFSQMWNVLVIDVHKSKNSAS